jgi:hypothetical protein
MLAVDGSTGKYPQFAGNVKTVYSHPLSEGSSSNAHYDGRAGTYMMVGDALGRAMYDLLEGSSGPDETPPGTTSFNPANGASDVSTGTNLVATFSESIAIGTGDITIHPIDNSGDIVIAITDATQVSVSGNTLTINPAANLTPGKQYAVQIAATAIDDLAGNSFAGITDDTTWSFTTASPDTTPPTPNPMTFASPPAALGQSSITMTATTATDPGGVEYFFECTAGGGPDSGWQSATVFTPTGLAPGTTYSYTVKARDAALNETAPSAPASATTDAPDTTAPSPDPMTFAVAARCDSANHRSP